MSKNIYLYYEFERNKYMEIILDWESILSKHCDNNDRFTMYSLFMFSRQILRLLPTQLMQEILLCMF